MTELDIDMLLVGAGPANLALAVALEELTPDTPQRTLIVEQHDSVVWQRGMLLPWSQSQVSFLKDLVTLRNPRSAFSFVNYLHSVGRLDEFINLGSATPYRLEISGYLSWVADSLSTTKVEYGRRVVSVEPRRDAAGGIGHWSVTMADDTVLTCRDLVIGAGRDPHIPDVFGSLPAGRVIHSTGFAHALDALDPQQIRRVAVIGAAQSAAEMLWTMHQTFPAAECTMIMRSIGLNSYESSKFTNEIFYSSFIDTFHEAPPEARAQLLREMHRTNYAGLAPTMLDTLYRQTYQERLTGTERLHMVTMTDVVGARTDGDETVLELGDRRNGSTSEFRCDVVLLGTGFERGMPRMVRDMCSSFGLDDIRVDRHYALGLPPGSGASCYLQGVNEATHGIADSLLSVLAARSADIVSDLMTRRAGAPLVSGIAAV